MAGTPWYYMTSHLSSIENILSCNFCESILIDPMKLGNCGHTVCKSCLKRNNKCPLCKIPTPQKDIKVDFFAANILKCTLGIKSFLNQYAKPDDVKMGIEKLCLANKLQFQDCTSVSEEVEKVQEEKLTGKAIKNVLINKPIERLISRKSSRTPNVKKESVSHRKNQQISDMPNTADSRRRNHERKSNQKYIDNKEPANCNNFSEPHESKKLKSKPTASRSLHTIKDKQIIKRNHKGETALHIACLTGNYEKAKELLDLGADPNLKDNAGWTPLHEAVNHGFVQIADLLLQSGAMVNVPGYCNKTPLHDAVINNQIDAAKLLLSYGANLNARNISGKTPLECSLTSEMTMALDTQVEPVLINSVINKAQPLDIVLYGCGLNKTNTGKLKTLSVQHKIKLVNSFSKEVTHVVVELINGQCNLSIGILQGILEGKWIVDVEWVNMSLDMQDIVDPDSFEAKGMVSFANNKAPQKSRLNASNLLPGLFSGCHIYLPSPEYTFEKLKISKAEMGKIIKSGNGVHLSRQPDPEGIPEEECTVPYHSKPTSTLSNCSHYIIYNKDVELKYNMQHLKSLPFEWFIKCIGNFELLERDPL